MADLLICSQCKGDFKDPRALPCLHIFCLRCLVELADCAYEEDAITCPVCEEFHPLPSKGVFGFPQNFPIKNFLKMIKENEQRSPKMTFCRQHPEVESDFLCLEKDCNGQILCAVCVKESHQNHHIFPAKEVCEMKLARVRILRQALKKNDETLVMLKKRLEKNKRVMKNEVSRRVSEYYTILEHVAGQVEGDIDKQTYDQELRLVEQEGRLLEAQRLLESLEIRLSDTIPNIIQANEDKRLDSDLDNLHRFLEGWQFKCGMPVIEAEKGDAKLFISRDTTFDKVKLREEVVKGSTMDSVEPECRTLGQRLPGPEAPISAGLPVKKTSEKIPEEVITKTPDLPYETAGIGTQMEVTPELPTAEFKKMGILTSTRPVRETCETYHLKEAATPTELTPKLPELALGAGNYDRVIASRSS